MANFGRIGTGTEVRHAVEATGRLFLPDYLEAVAAQAGKPLNALGRPSSWLSTDELDNWPDDRLPAIVIVSPGLADEPVKEGATYSATWLVDIAVVLSSTSREATKASVEQWVAALRALYLQHPSLPYRDVNDEMQIGPASATTWLDESYDDGPADGSRTLGAGRISLAITVDDILDVSLGSKNPSPGSGPTDPILIEETDVKVERYPLA